MNKPLQSKHIFLASGAASIACALLISSMFSGVRDISYSTMATIKEVPVSLGVASTREELIAGLSGQKDLKEDHGLLFLFGAVGPHGIWMKDMNFPIDVLWLDEKGAILYIKKNFLPSSYPETITPPVQASMVLELSSGFAVAHKIGVGDQVIFFQK